MQRKIWLYALSYVDYIFSNEAALRGIPVLVVFLLGLNFFVVGGLKPHHFFASLVFLFSYLAFLHHRWVWPTRDFAEILPTTETKDHKRRP